MKTCEECAWENVCDENKNEICNNFSYECGCGNHATLILNNGKMCSECVLNKLDVERWTVTHYMLDGEYLGNDGENDWDDIFGDLDNVKIIKE